MPVTHRSNRRAAVASINAFKSLIAVALITVTFTAPGAQAQHTSVVSSNNWTQQTQKKKTPAYPTSRLTKAVDLPDIPDYPKSHKFVGGDSCQMTTGTSFNLCFSVNEEKQAILDWYSQALQSYGWQNIQPSPLSVSAKKRGNSCNIMTTSDFAAKGRTLVMISCFSGSQR